VYCYGEINGGYIATCSNKRMVKNMGFRI
jgi:hypothetical protein